MNWRMFHVKHAPFLYLEPVFHVKQILHARLLPTKYEGGTWRRIVGG